MDWLVRGKNRRTQMSWGGQGRVDLGSTTLVARMGCNAIRLIGEYETNGEVHH